MVQIAQTPALTNSGVEFQKSKFDELIWKKGYEAIIEKAIYCPCRDEGGHQQSICRNCGGSGWLFINPIEDRFVMYSMNLQTQFRAWSREEIGTTAISAMSRVEFTFMDRLTIKDAHNIFNEFVFPQLDAEGDDFFAFLSYEIVEIQYAAMFVATEQKLRILVEGTDFTIANGNVLLFNKDLRNEVSDKVSVTIRYKHKAQYHIIDVNREFMSSWVQDDGKEKQIRLPISAVGRRAHFQMDKDNWKNTNILDNETSQYFQV